MAASVCLRYYEMNDTLIDRNEPTSQHAHDHDVGIDDDFKHDLLDDFGDFNNSPYDAAPSHLHAHGKLNNGLTANGYSNSNGYSQHTHSNGQPPTKKKKKSTKKKKSKCYLVADLSNIACSVSIIECKERRHSDMVKVQHCAGSINDGLWKMVNAFSLYVVKSFVDGYKGYYRPNLNIDSLGNVVHQRLLSSPHLPGNSKQIQFYESITKYKYKNDTFVYEQLEKIDNIERHEDDEQDDDEEEEDGALILNESNSEALKCRFRSQMLCDTIIEHLHDQYKNDEVQIHYEKFYRSFSLQLILTSKKLHEVALNPFLFNLNNCIDKILEQFHSASLSENSNSNKKKKSMKRRKRKKKRFQIDECLLVGDGGNIPEVVNLFADIFNINLELDTQAMVARGCAIVCAVDQEFLASPISLDLLPHSIRMEDATNNEQNENTLIISAQNPCPCKKTITRYTYRNNQSVYKLRFYEGESKNNKLCTLIGVFEIRDITKRPKRETKIVIAVHVDRNCIMFVSAEDVVSKPPKPLTVVKLQH